MQEVNFPNDSSKSICYRINCASTPARYTEVPISGTSRMWPYLRMGSFQMSWVKGKMRPRWCRVDPESSMMVGLKWSGKFGQTPREDNQMKLEAVILVWPQAKEMSEATKKLEEARKDSSLVFQSAQGPENTLHFRPISPEMRKNVFFLKNI